MDLAQFLSDFTVQNVLAGAILLGVSSGTLGVFAVLRGQSLLGDALSHATLPGVALGFLLTGTRNLGAITAGALVSGSLAALFVLLLVRNTRLKNDAALGSALSIFFALGVILLTYVQQSGASSQAGLDSFLFGQAAAILRSDLPLLAGLTVLLLALVLLLWKEFKLITFDPQFARTLGLPVATLETLLTIAIALAIVIGLQLVGVVLMSAMLVAPAVAARQWSRRMEGMAVSSALFGATAGVIGSLISAAGRGLSTGPLIVLAATALVIVSLLFAPERGIVWAWLRAARQGREFRRRRLLETMFGLAVDHEDPGYRIEEGMLRAAQGRGVRGDLRELERAGLVEEARHMPGEGNHWRLTGAGFESARAHVEGGGQGEEPA